MSSFSFSPFVCGETVCSFVYADRAIVSFSEVQKHSEKIAVFIIPSAFDYLKKLATEINFLTNSVQSLTNIIPM